MDEKKFKTIYEQYNKEAERIKQKAKENGTWQKYGFDSNNHLFNKLNIKTMAKDKQFKAMQDK